MLELSDKSSNVITIFIKNINSTSENLILKIENILKAMDSTYVPLLSIISSIQSKKHIWEKLSDDNIKDIILPCIKELNTGVLIAENLNIGIPLAIKNWFYKNKKMWIKVTLMNLI